MGTYPHSQHLNNQKPNSDEENRGIPNIDVFKNPNLIFISKSQYQEAQSFSPVNKKPHPSPHPQSPPSDPL